MLIMLAFAALLLAPDNPVLLLVLFLLACLKVWRTHDMETDDSGGGHCDSPIDRPDVLRHCDLT